MSQPPASPSIYHITHLDNLASIVAAGFLFSDATMVARGGPAGPIGMTNIKQRRLGLPVRCHPSTCVGEYVPFNFCPRSVMLCLIYYRNHPELAYRGGQEPIVHLEANLGAAVAWANAQGLRWAFTLQNAGAGYAEFRDDLGRLGDIDWNAVISNDFRDPAVKDAKQAEFLLQDRFPWSLVTRVGVSSAAVQAQAQAAIGGTGQGPGVVVRPTWYF